MAKTRKARRGGGYGTSAQFFSPSALPPAAGFFSPVISTAPTADAIRPALVSTFQAGGRRMTRRRGGFSPSIMGGFIPNAQAAIVPAALYMVYHTMVPKVGSKMRKLGGRLMKSLNRKTRKQHK